MLAQLHVYLTQYFHGSLARNINFVSLNTEDVRMLV